MRPREAHQRLPGFEQNPPTLAKPPLSKQTRRKAHGISIKPGTMSAYPRFFSQPFRYLRWASIEKPAIFWSIVIGSLGPVLVFTVPPIRERLGDARRPQIPLTYPVPSGPRKRVDGYDD